MDNLHIFTDGSVNAQSKVGYGACLMVSDLSVPIGSISDSVKVKRFEDTSSTKLELQTLLWALEEVMIVAKGNDFRVSAYTDSQNIINLPDRRARLEEQNFFSSKNKRLNHYLLYQQFYRLMSQINCKLIKVVGHKPSVNKNELDRLFSLVDKASRRALREGG